MFMVRMFNVNNGCRLVTRVFFNISDAEDYCDYHDNFGWTIWEFCIVDTTLSDMLETCWG